MRLGKTKRFFSTKVMSLVNRVTELFPDSLTQSVVAEILNRNPGIFLQVIGTVLNRSPSFDTMPVDLAIGDRIHFEDLAGLFSSTSLDHAIISMPVRQAAYIFGLVRQMEARRVIEIGRYKGGSTLLLAAAMEGEGILWSVDNGEKEKRLLSAENARPSDNQLKDRLKELGLGNVDIIVGDSRFIEIDTGEVDLVLIDGDHSYEGVKNDFERFGMRVRAGGVVLFDDAVPEHTFGGYSEGVSRFVTQVLDKDEFELHKTVNRMVHLQRNH